MLLLWDTRSPTEPKLQIQAHDREILAVACSPAVEHLIVTASADKVGSLFFSSTLLTNTVIDLCAT
jgi:histone-binding protein RBBP4